MAILRIPGVVVPGHQVASGLGERCPYPGGTLRQQMPHFLARGVDLSGFHIGTINVDLAPVSLRIVGGQRLEGVEWTDLIPPETFSFVPADIEHAGRRFRAMVYYPHPETKVENFQSPTVLELLAERVPGLEYGDVVWVHLDSDDVSEVGP